MASGDALPIPRKAIAFRLGLVILDADGDLVIGAAGLDSEISKDGGAFADCTNEATEIGSSGFYTLDLTSTEMTADMVCIQIKTSTTGAKTTPVILYPLEDGDWRVNVVQHNGVAMTTGAVTTDGGNSATSFETDLAQTTDTYWKDAWLLITSGTMAGQVKRVTAYNGTTKIITVSGGFTGTPADGVTFVLANR